MKTFSIEEALRFGWEKTKRHFWFLLLVLICSFVVIMIPNAIFKNGLVLQLVQFAIQIFIGLGVVQLGLSIYDTDIANWNEFFKPAGKFLTGLASNILITIAVTIGFIILIVPGVILSIMFCFTQYRIVDSTSGPIECMKESAAITKGVRWHLFLFGIVIFLLNVLGVILLGIGLLFTAPMSLLASAYVYRKLTEQELPVSSPVPTPPQVAA